MTQFKLETCPTGNDSVEDLEKYLESVTRLNGIADSIGGCTSGISRGSNVQSEASLKMRIRLRKKLEKKNKKK
tara:strand:- start:4 stop:222 length:219 start_codon:yes stop_codon:yes gene_type:complete